MPGRREFGVEKGRGSSVSLFFWDLLFPRSLCLWSSEMVLPAALPGLSGSGQGPVVSSSTLAYYGTVAQPALARELPTALAEEPAALGGVAAGLQGRLPSGSLPVPALPLGRLLATLDIRADGAWERMEAGAHQPRNLGSEGPMKVEMWVQQPVAQRTEQTPLTAWFSVLLMPVVFDFGRNTSAQWCQHWSSPAAQMLGSQLQMTKIGKQRFLLLS